MPSKMMTAVQTPVYQMRVGDKIATSTHGQTVVRAEAVRTIDYPGQTSRLFKGHGHKGHIHVNGRECWDLAGFFMKAVESAV